MGGRFGHVSRDYEIQKEMKLEDWAAKLGKRYDWEGDFGIGV